jgi:hypothetical protein
MVHDVIRLASGKIFTLHEFREGKLGTPQEFIDIHWIPLMGHGKTAPDDPIRHH